MLNHSVFYISCVTKKSEYDIISVNPLYIIINRINGYFEEKDGDKYLVISAKNGDTVQKYQMFLID